MTGLERITAALSAAGGRLPVSCEDGTLLCYARGD